MLKPPPKDPAGEGGLQILYPPATSITRSLALRSNTIATPYNNSTPQCLGIKKPESNEKRPLNERVRIIELRSLGMSFPQTEAEIPQSALVYKGWTDLPTHLISIQRRMSGFYSKPTIGKRSGRGGEYSVVRRS